MLLNLEDFIHEIDFKDDDVIDELIEAPLAIQHLAKDFLEVSESIGIKPVIVRILGKVEGDSGVHDEYRAIDFRNEFDGDFLYDSTEEQHVVTMMNLRYPRDDGKLACISHKFNKGPLHFHCQLPYALINLRKKQ